ncbi:MAG: hypothetical protein E5X46_23170 [Mesorhizobium sp.]|nr:MAG: hypothetical protein E5X47_22195 [Mesorhizobium sp.]TIQ55447.1 MAG: hypothetical protein E5X46_23170 [Mesorhizobium sp.]
MMKPSLFCLERFSFDEKQTRSNSLFLRNPGRKTATHFSWNCSKPGCRWQTLTRAARNRSVPRLNSSSGLHSRARSIGGLLGADGQAGSLAIWTRMPPAFLVGTVRPLDRRSAPNICSYAIPDGKPLCAFPGLLWPVRPCSCCRRRRSRRRAAPGP